MRITKVLSFFGPIFFLVVGCSSLATKTEDNLTSTPIAGVTGTPGLVQSMTPTVFTTSTRPISTVTPTIMPTVQVLAAEDAHLRFLEVLQNEECLLPCWLNLTPGQSTIYDMYSSLGPLRSTLSTSNMLLPDDGYIDFDHLESGVDISIQSDYFVVADTNIIEAMAVQTFASRKASTGDVEDVFTAQSYRDILQNYLLPNLLGRYDEPTQILINLELNVAEPSSPDYFHLWFMYPEDGIIVSYDGPADIGGNTILICPSQSFVSFWVVSPKNRDLYMKILSDVSGLKMIAPSPPFYKSTLEAFEMTPDDFFEALKYPSELCLETPIDIWTIR